MIKIKSSYAPRYPQTEIHPMLESHRFSVLVTHRQMGKTVCAINHIIKMALCNRQKNARYFYIAPYLKQAKMLVWDYLKRYTAPLAQVPDPQKEGHFLNLLKINEQELSIGVKGKFVIYVRGADNPDALRGTYADGVVLDEYGDIKPNIYDEIIRPMLLSRNGWTLFFGTPRGQNQFYDVYRKAAQKYAEDPKGEWWAALYRADQTGVIAPEELRSIQEQTPANTYRQEYLCDFTASSENVLIPIDEVTAAFGRYYKEDILRGAPKVMGVDPARFGDDKSVIFMRQGLQAYKPLVFEKMDSVDLAGRVAQKIREFGPDAVFVDAGNGAGVIDILRRNGFEVTEVPFNSRPAKEGQYANKRAEIWGEMAAWLKSGGALEEQEGLAADLTCATYDFNAAGQMRLESKDGIKKRLGKSPDMADALALTFAFPVQGKENRLERKPEFAVCEYEFLEA